MFYFVFDTSALSGAVVASPDYLDLLMDDALFIADFLFFGGLPAEAPRPTPGISKF